MCQHCMACVFATDCGQFGINLDNLSTFFCFWKLWAKMGDWACPVMCRYVRCRFLADVSVDMRVLYSLLEKMSISSKFLLFLFLSLMKHRDRRENVSCFCKAIIVEHTLLYVTNTTVCFSFEEYHFFSVIGKKIQHEHYCWVVCHDNYKIYPWINNNN